MKTTNIIIITVFGILIIFTACSKINFKNQSTEISVIIDITDPLTAKPKSTEVISVINQKNNKWSGADFRLLYITNVSYNPMFEAKIESENEWLSNQFQRAEKIKKFYAEINTIISNTSNETIGKDNSAVYFTMAKELNRLSQSSKATTKLLLVYSDLMENTPKMSFYDNDTFDKTKTAPNTIQQYFETQQMLTNLNGIKVYLIFQPENMKQDEDYKVVSGFYKSWLESKGATVEITANLN
ncbi:MAG: hypothetical protein NTZ33_15510 [Bacteroidetes bacterium]|nr:hypothetical protein [Bacteroidota bacterium]